MPNLRSSHVEVYVFRRRRGRVEYLALRRGKDRRKLPGIWQPVTGKRNFREPAPKAALRELQEETGLEPRRMWCLETLTIYYEAETDSFAVLPLFVAEVSANDRVHLSREHMDFAWLPHAQCGRRYLWASQRRALDAVRTEVLRGGVLARANEITYQSPRRTRTRASRRTR